MDAVGADTTPGTFSGAATPFGNNGDGGSSSCDRVHMGCNRPIRAIIGRKTSFVVDNRVQ
jgi:hypothetical protein